MKYTRNDYTRFWASVNKDGPTPDQSHPDYKGLSACWVWSRSPNITGYGAIRYGGKSMLAHRVSYIINCGEIPEGSCVLHKCDNRMCCNPDHLFLGTNSDNIADREKKGRRKRPKGEAHPNAKLTAEQVSEMRSIFTHGGVSKVELARQFGISKEHAWRILRGDNWSHVDTEEFKINQESLAVFKETGKTPRQLADERQELIECLKLFMGNVKREVIVADPHRLTEARNTITHISETLARLTP